MLLAQHFVRRMASRYHQYVEGLAGAAERALRGDHSWPGNVRELEHAVERLVLLAEEPPLKAVDLGLYPAEVRDPAGLEA
ncbi:MAG: hypothetical protein U0168_04325 [Nannocystaceae bacterium]